MSKINETLSPGDSNLGKKVAEPFEKFFRSESSSGILLLLFTIIAMILANSTLSSQYFDFWNINIRIGVGNFELNKPLILWINDGLMAIFFFFVGLEIKREIRVGELSTLKEAALPIGAAIGGMAIPALAYIVFNLGEPGESGWGIPMATDIAFALGVLALAGKKIPLSLKIFLTALAIVDDLGAVLVIALFYTANLKLGYILIALMILAMLFLFNRLKIRHPAFYIVLGIVLWFLFLKSGVHTTVAGVLLAMTIPAHTRIDRGNFIRKIKHYITRFQRACGNGVSLLTNQEQQESVQAIELACHEVESPLQRLLHDLHFWVLFIIMPVFAFSNAGMVINAELFETIDLNVFLGILFGLVIGKPIGILLFSYLLVKLKIASLPAFTNWGQFAGLGFLAGIGFTMSLFINGLAFQIEVLSSTAKLAILVASVIAGIAGFVLLNYSTNRKLRKEEANA